MSTRSAASPHTTRSEARCRPLAPLSGPNPSASAAARREDARAGVLEADREGASVDEEVAAGVAQDRVPGSTSAASAPVTTTARRSRSGSASRIAAATPEAGRPRRRSPTRRARGRRYSGRRGRASVAPHPLLFRARARRGGLRARRRLGAGPAPERARTSRGHLSATRHRPKLGRLYIAHMNAGAAARLRPREAEGREVGAGAGRPRGHRRARAGARIRLGDDTHQVLTIDGRTRACLRARPPSLPGAGLTLTPAPGTFSSPTRAAARRS